MDVNVSCPLIICTIDNLDVLLHAARCWPEATNQRLKVTHFIIADPHNPLIMSWEANFVKLPGHVR